MRIAAGNSTTLVASVAATILLVGVARAQTPAPAPATPPAAPPAAPLSCETPGHRQFDFWIGEWDVFRPDGTLVGTNRITLILGTCVLLENWKGTSGLEGWSFNVFDAADGRWHQNWVDSHGARLDLVGSLKGRNMVLTGEKTNPDGSRTIDRITWEPIDPNKVRQLWEQSKDGGKTWSVAFDATYVRRAGGPSSAARHGR